MMMNENRITMAISLVLIICWFSLFNVTMNAVVLVAPPQQEAFTVQKHHDRILKLPGQPAGLAKFKQYGGYVTVDEQAGRALYYYFVEAADQGFKNSAPLLLWLSGGPGCSSLGEGAMSEIGPFRVNRDGKSLYENVYSWNRVANLLFIESPAGVGFSYSNKSSDIPMNNDQRTADDSYVFLLNWLERFPEYKDRDFYIAGESYAGHYVPQLAVTILTKNKESAGTKIIINLKGIALGNPVLEDEIGEIGTYEYWWSHALISDNVIESIRANCILISLPSYYLSQECAFAMVSALEQIEDIYEYNIYAPKCPSSEVTTFDPCNDNYVKSYLNSPQVQLALHAKLTQWESCRDNIYDRSNETTSMVPLLQYIMAKGIQILVYSGDFDAVIPFMHTKNVLKKLNLTEKVQWGSWKLNNEIAGYRVIYDGGLTFTTVRAAGHMVPSDQGERALGMIEIYLRGEAL